MLKMQFFGAKIHIFVNRACFACKHFWASELVGTSCILIKREQKTSQESRAWQMTRTVFDFTPPWDYDRHQHQRRWKFWRIRFLKKECLRPLFLANSQMHLGSQTKHFFCSFWKRKSWVSASQASSSSGKSKWSWAH